MEWTMPQHEEVSLKCEISSYSNAELEAAIQPGHRWREETLVLFGSRSSELAKGIVGETNLNSGDLMEEQRKHAILFPPTLLSARKLIESIEPDKPNVCRISF